MPNEKYETESGLGMTLPGQNAEESCSGTSQTSSEDSLEKASPEERQFFEWLETIELTLIVEFYAHRATLQKGGVPTPFRMDVNYANGWFWANVEDSASQCKDIR